MRFKRQNNISLLVVVLIISYNVSFLLNNFFMLHLFENSLWQKCQVRLLTINTCGWAISTPCAQWKFQCSGLPFLFLCCTCPCIFGRSLILSIACSLWISVCRRLISFIIYWLHVISFCLLFSFFIIVLCPERETNKKNKYRTSRRKKKT